VERSDPHGLGSDHDKLIWLALLCRSPYSSKGGDDEPDGPMSEMPLIRINIVQGIVAESTTIEVGGAWHDPPDRSWEAKEAAGEGKSVAWLRRVA